MKHKFLTAKENMKPFFLTISDIDGLVQDYSKSIANALELLQSCTKSSIWFCRPHQQYNQLQLFHDLDTSHTIGIDLESCNFLNLYTNYKAAGKIRF